MRFCTPSAIKAMLDKVRAANTHLSEAELDAKLCAGSSGDSPAPPLNKEPEPRLPQFRTELVPIRSYEFQNIIEIKNIF